MITATRHLLKARPLINHVDPTHTTVLRNRFVAEMNTRFDAVRRIIMTAIWDEDVFGLRPNEGLVSNTLTTPGFRRFNFRRNDQKVAAFMRWLEEMVRSSILDVTSAEQVGESINAAWTNKYINQAYKGGVKQARAALVKAGVPNVPKLTDDEVLAWMGQSFHVETAALAFIRTYNELKGVTDAMDHQISRVLAQGLAQGLGPAQIARNIDTVITGIGRSLEVKDSLGRTISAKRRAEMIARTETIRAHAHATLQEYANWGILGVEVYAEIRTAGDGRVCIECSNLEGNVYTLAEATNIIPVHTMCRCAWIPITKEDASAVFGVNFDYNRALSEPIKNKDTQAIIDANSLKSLLKDAILN